MNERIFTRAQMESMGLPWSAIESEITDSWQDGAYFRIIFKDPNDMKYWQTEYAVGSKEAQKNRPNDFETEIKCWEVKREKALIDRWVLA